MIGRKNQTGNYPTEAGCNIKWKLYFPDLLLKIKDITILCRKINLDIFMNNHFILIHIKKVIN
jgi:hypothetical protein